MLSVKNAARRSAKRGAAAKRKDENILDDRARAVDFGLWHRLKYLRKKARAREVKMYTFLLALIYLAFISLGLPDSLLGSGWPVMHVELGVPVSYMGIVTMVVSGGTIVSSLLSDRLTRRLGTKWVTVVSVFLTAAALIGFSFTDRFWMMIVFAIPYGLGAGAIDAALNNYVAVHYASKHMSWLHCFWGVGTIVSPFVMSKALASSGWNSGFLIVGVVQAAIGVILLATVPVWKVNKRAEEDVPQKRIGTVGALKLKGVPFLLIAFFAYCAGEATVMGWASTYFVQVKALDAEKAAQLASLFYIGMTAGRLASGFVTERLGDRKMIAIGASVLAVGVVLVAIPADNVALAIAGFLIIGLGCAPIYPCMIHSTPGNFGHENSGAIIGLQMAFAYCGSTFMPPLFGAIGGKVGFGFMPWYLLGFFAVMIVMSELMFRAAAKRGKEGIAG